MTWSAIEAALSALAAKVSVWPPSDSVMLSWVIVSGVVTEGESLTPSVATFDDRKYSVSAVEKFAASVDVIVSKK
jgi:hypothetical protein